MNIKEFIETSGLLEEYVLGHLPENEAAGVECLAQTYPEIKQEIEVLNLSLGKYTETFKKTPPAFLKDQFRPAPLHSATPRGFHLRSQPQAPCPLQESTGCSSEPKSDDTTSKPIPERVLCHKKKSAASNNSWTMGLYHSSSSPLSKACSKTNELRLWIIPQTGMSWTSY